MSSSRWFACCLLVIVGASVIQTLMCYRLRGWLPCYNQVKLIDGAHNDSLMMLPSVE